MSTQFDFVKEIAKYGLENDQDNLLKTLSELIEHSKKTKKLNFALQLQSILKESLKEQKFSGLVKVESNNYYDREDEREIREFILDKVTSDYSFEQIICTDEVKEELSFFIKEHQFAGVIRQLELPISNKILFHGPSGCGKTLAAYILAGELNKMIYVVNLGAIVSSKLGETSKNISKIFKKAAKEDCIIFFDEFDSLGKIRDYSQDHGEMKRVVNTILQLFDYLPQDTMVIAATNQVNMLDEALLRRFDLIVKLDKPSKEQVEELVHKTLRNSKFDYDQSQVKKLLPKCHGLSFYSIQKTLSNAMKKSFINNQLQQLDTKIWSNLIASEKIALIKKEPVVPAQ
ncbi:AAA family ATPase [Mucilaginibacter sp. 22184]|uniref:AAA family ATPase n=1 Tax=Mucilaginibacter sp. 22184 TaxID=3453887 RepID=UPI003F8431AD